MKCPGRDGIKQGLKGSKWSVRSEPRGPPYSIPLLKHFLKVKNKFTEVYKGYKIASQGPPPTTRMTPESDRLHRRREEVRLLPVLYCPKAQKDRRTCSHRCSNTTMYSHQ